MSYHPGTGPVPDGDQYAGLDRFGRVVDQYWVKAGTPADRFQYGYDRNGNRLYRANLVDGAFSELYHVDGAANGYDDLNRLTAFARGCLNTAWDALVGPADRSQNWGLDALGNWGTVTTDGAAQTRSHNDQDQITSISGQQTPRLRRQRQHAL